MSSSEDQFTVPTAAEMKMSTHFLSSGTDPIQMENPDGTKATCWCVPYFWHGGCVGVYHDPMFKQFANDKKETLDALMRMYMGWSVTPSFIDTHDEETIKQEIALWVMVLPDEAPMFMLEMSKGIFFQYLRDEQGLPEDEVNRYMCLADYVVGCKVSHKDWSDFMSDNSLMSPFHKMSRGVATTEYQYFASAVQTAVRTQDFSWIESEEGKRAAFKAVAQFSPAPTQEELKRFRQRIGESNFAEIRGMMIDLGMIVPGEDGAGDTFQPPKREEITDPKEREKVESLRQKLIDSIGTDAFNNLSDDKGSSFGDDL